MSSHLIFLFTCGLPHSFVEGTEEVVGLLEFNGQHLACLSLGRVALAFVCIIVLGA